MQSIKNTVLRLAGKMLITAAVLLFCLAAPLAAQADPDFMALGYVDTVGQTPAGHNIVILGYYSIDNTNLPLSSACDMAIVTEQEMQELLKFIKDFDKSEYAGHDIYDNDEIYNKFVSLKYAGESGSIAPMPGSLYFGERDGFGETILWQSPDKIQLQLVTYTEPDMRGYEGAVHKTVVFMEWDGQNYIKKNEKEFFSVYAGREILKLLGDNNPASVLKNIADEFEMLDEEVESRRRTSSTHYTKEYYEENPDASK